LTNTTVFVSVFIYASFFLKPFGPTQLLPLAPAWTNPWAWRSSPVHSAFAAMFIDGMRVPVKSFFAMQIRNTSSVEEARGQVQLTRLAALGNIRARVLTLSLEFPVPKLLLRGRFLRDLDPLRVHAVICPIAHNHKMRARQTTKSKTI